MREEIIGDARLIGRWVCEQCNKRFDRDRSGARPIRFCGQHCYHTWNRANGGNSGQFEKKSTPWNKGLSGIHLSPETEFKKGRRSRNRLPLGSVTIRFRKKDNSPRAWVKIAEPNTWRERSKVVWEKENGAIPKGHVIHHRDRNSLNDDPYNLQALTRAAHINEHRRDWVGAKNAA